MACHAFASKASTTSGAAWQAAAAPTVDDQLDFLSRTALDAQADRVGASWVATAHHANDRAETVLMPISRQLS